MRYCQTPAPGEEEIIDQILRCARLRQNGIAVEIGSNNGEWLSNTKFLEQFGFTRILFDREPFPGVIQADVRPDNVNELFAQHGVPEDPAVLSIDIDGNDYWVRQALNTRAAVIVMEFNGSRPPLVPVTIPYQPNFVWADDGYYGASWSALKNLNERMGYRYVCQCGSLNMFFIRADLATSDMPWNDKVPHRVIAGRTPRDEWMKL